MVDKSNTDEKLSTIVDRNDGRRQSLILDDDYNENETSQGLDDQYEAAIKLRNSKTLEDTSNVSDTEDSRSTISETITQPTEDNQVNVEPLMRKLDEIHNAAPTRLRRRKSKGKGTSEKKQATNKTEEPRFRSGFGDIKFYSVSSTIFDSSYFKNSEFFGIYVLFWLGTAFLMMNNIVHSYFESNEGFFQTAVMKTLRKDLVKIGFTDLGMYLGTYFAFFLQYACLKGWIVWDSSGWIIQAVYDFIHGAFWLYFASDQCMSYPWIGKVFLVLHNLVFIMKMHSYAFYNGYLWRILRELEFSEDYLERLTNGKVRLPEKYDLERTKNILDGSIRFCKFELEYQSSATTMSSDSPIESFDLEDDIHDLQKRNIVKFPTNVNLFNFFEYSMFPTLVYTLNYPRTRRIRWQYVLEKTCGVFGIIFLMILVAQNWMYPIIQRAIALQDMPTADKWRGCMFILLDMIPPFLMEYLFTFFLIWDAILNVIAELSRFADRDFYGPWWSCSDWSEYARIWNRPVHKFLLRHVYHSSISVLKLNNSRAILGTFILSSLVHELVMFVIFNRLRGYLLVMQMSQLPLVALCNTRFMKNRKVLGNVMCWFGFISVPSMICTFYLIF
ncbi:DEHA2F24222p [Debaryomyces hansenii CBS767]|uniref:O-acyltransferase n=1 Tax=Debaryomyces hansenii (strain ATCC 36239 / CBS 767 / BCRC 21394 / JCM 1990 / NBRC 0083 / IGC 2968) TaxID=284592 RepID=B5RUM8_DEBHA|nr:DEHA2F24222p [Debaryomyces hansenii CBS767]CAR66406.1 DEHA2F24222p [Debaryomyces hansenii CBS767]|eukprot:XP_002770889.1 DEHA2F24222p [Debaryomyces hansenii CBS767]